ncbi:MAG: hypothetical protein KF836_12260 [Fimbriimonadaceae bacterium]|nr:hypothetical protein [Fimbriimonadaceae bacterium]
MLYVLVLLLLPFVMISGEFPNHWAISGAIGSASGIACLVLSTRRSWFTILGIFSNNGFSELDRVVKLRLTMELIFFWQVLFMPILAFIPWGELYQAIMFAITAVIGLTFGIWNNKIILPYQQKDL